MKNVALFLFAFGLTSPLAHAKWVYQTAKVQSPMHYGYMIAEDDESPNTDVVYVLHGAAGNETHAKNFAEELGAEWNKAGYAPPRIIGISFGMWWLLVTPNASPTSGRMNAAIEEIYPSLEKMLKNPVIGERQVVGFSMGGLNALHLTLYAPEKFTRIVMLSPAVQPISPFASEAEMRAFADRNGLAYDTDPDKFSVKDFQNIMAEEIPTPEDYVNWDSEVQLPLAFKRLEAEGKKAPSLYISTGRQDTPFFEGGERLAATAARAGFPTTWVPQSGGHTPDMPAAARFLMH